MSDLDYEIPVREVGDEITEDEIYCFFQQGRNEIVVELTTAEHVVLEVIGPSRWKIKSIIYN